MNLWPTQQIGIDELLAAIEAGERRLCLTAPTGGGKSLIMREMIRRLDWPTALLTNRRMLCKQLGRGLTEDGIPFGIRASGEEGDPMARVQLCMVQTELSRVYKRATVSRHWAKLVLVDELHVNCSGAAQKLWEDYIEDGCVGIGFTATPLGVGHMVDRLILAGTPTQLRGFNALVPATVYAPDEPDAKSLKQSEKTGEFTEGSVRKAIMTKVIFGRVFEHWQRYNPDARPAILFAPGVAESIWFCEQFAAKGVRCAHIDGEKCWLDGEFLPADDETRDYIGSLSKSGEVAIVSNRFVLREGIDWPWLYHGILATCFGSLTSYLQSVGRLLRAHSDKSECVIQDHGGNWHRHGSPNQDRKWDLSMTPYKEAQIRQERMREKKEREPITCPQCHAVRLGGPKCHACGFEHTLRARMVIQKNGTLREMSGDIYKPRRRAEATARMIEDWKKTYYRMKRAGRTFKQAEALFAMEHNWQYPPKNLPLMPVSDADWYQKVQDVPYSDLVQPSKTPEPQKEMAFR